MKIGRIGAVLAATISFIFVGSSANAVTFNVTGSSFGGGPTITGTIVGDASLTSLSSIDLFVSGIADPLTIIVTYTSPVLHAANVSNTFPTSLSPIYFSFAGGPSPTDINQMIIDAYNNAVTVADNTFNPVNCGNDLDCQAQILQLQSEAISQATATELGSFIAIAVAADTPLPAALPLFATGLGALGLVGWRRKRKQAA